MRPHAFHNGVDIAAPEGTPVRSVLPGRVLAVAPTGRWDRYGHTVVVDHGLVDGIRLVSLSAHLSAISVHEGDAVIQGAELGRVGRTAGLRTDPGRKMDRSAAHLHLEFFEKRGRTWSLAGQRLDAGSVLGALGIVAPQYGAMFSACKPGAPVVPLENRIGHHVGVGLGVGLVALLAYWWWTR
jgi:murein DD-endopeptidase MepM/ murein hydrolase activator NlpD